MSSVGCGHVVRQTGHMLLIPPRGLVAQGRLEDMIQLKPLLPHWVPGQEEAEQAFSPENISRVSLETTGGCRASSQMLNSQVSGK